MATRKSQAKLFGKQSIGMSLSGDIAGQLAQFTRSIQEKALRPAAYAAAKVLYDEMKLRVPKGEGKLDSALYTWHDEKQSVDGKQVYQVGVNKRKAPHWHLLEFGHWRHYQTIKIDGQWVTLTDRPLSVPVWVPASPYIRPSYDAKIREALDAAKRRLAEKVKELSQ